MSRFDKHFRLHEADVIEYAKEKLDIFDKYAQLQCEEIGDGNINYIFRVWDEETGKSVIIKHADIELRDTPGRLLSTDRSWIEAEILELQGKLAPDLVPKIYKYDPIMCCLTMEDLSDHENLRYALIQHKMFPQLADDITTFMVNTLLMTTDALISPKKKKKLVQRYINIDLCEITENIVYTEPYTDFKGENIVIEPNREFVKRELYNDFKLHLEVAKLKYSFMNKAQALIHGDLHSGSIFVKQDSTKVIDPEFAFYGPMGYDVGNVVGNLFFAWVNAYITIDDETFKKEFLNWLENTIIDVVELFKIKFIKLFREKVADRMANTEGFDKWYLSTILEETAGVAGLEILRRTVGSAKVRDITIISNIAKRTKAERILILLGKKFIMSRNNYKHGKDYIETVKETAQIVEKEQY